MPKPFLTFQAQIDFLENEKNLLVQDSEYARNKLEQIGYFGLIGGYKQPFKNPTTRKYKDGTRFEDIVALYEFDEELRELFLKYILKIERHIRSLLSYSFTEKYGEQQSEYLNPGNLAVNRKNKKDVDKLISILDKLANRNSDYPYINHQRQTYGNVPLWVLFNGVSFGTLSKFYSFATQDIQCDVAKNYDKVNQKQLGQYLGVITKYRNVCAHGERLYSYQTYNNEIPDTALHNKLGIPQNGTQYTLGKHDLFAVVIAFRYLLPNDEFKRFKASLMRLIQNYLKSTGAMAVETLYQYMGFPSNWSKITTYRK
ncbi:MAG: Abi family protein [Eubacteriales bacterium]|nr:Abi family protein [Eubacteriales bacterium]